MRTYEIFGKASSRVYLEMMFEQLGMHFGISQMNMFGGDSRMAYFTCFVLVSTKDVTQACRVIRDVCRRCQYDGHQMVVGSSLFDYPSVAIMLQFCS